VRDEQLSAMVMPKTSGGAVRISKDRIVGYDAGRYTTGWNA